MAAMDSTTLNGLVRRFVRGYVAARGQADAVVTGGPAGVHVAYGEGMGRRDELFCVPAGGAIAIAPGRRPEWLTVFRLPGTAADTPVPEGFDLAADECFMARPCHGGDRPEPPFAIGKVGLPDKARFDATPGFSPMVDDPAVGHFAAAVDGVFAASARYAFGAAGDVVIDRVVTRPEYRRRGLAAHLMRAILADAAANGAETALLISGAQGMPLYRHLGFKALCSVSAYRVATPAG